MSKKIRNVSDQLLLEILEAVIERGEPVRSVMEHYKGKHKLSRESFYTRLFPEGIRRGHFRLMALPHRQLERELAHRYGVDSGRLHVVSAPPVSACRRVAQSTADLLLELVLELASGKERVRIGLGGGYAVGRCAETLADLLARQTRLPALGFHAISTGNDIYRFDTAPNRFLGYFEPLPTDVETVALYAPAVVPTSDYAKVKGHSGVVEAVEAAREIDIVVTSLASREDDHGTLRQFGQVGNSRFRSDALEGAGWVGDLLFAPYSKTGPIEKNAGVRAFTLFELRDLRALAARKDKHVVVMASPCWVCGRKKTEAVRPLLRRPELRVWTHLVTDQDTAEALNA